MKAKILGIASLSLETGGGFVVNHYFPDLYVVGWILIAIGIVSFVICLSWHSLHVDSFVNKTRGSIKMMWKVLIHPKKASDLLALVNKQIKSPSEYLLPVIEYIDLNRQGSAHNDNDVYVRFQIDSHLLFPVTEFYVFVKLYLAPDTVSSSESDWYEIEKPERYAPIGILERYPFGERIVHLKGETFGEKTLLEWMQDFRKGKPLLAMFKIGIKFKKDDKPIPDFPQELQGGGPRYIAPINDYRMA
jgi:hypothetical protein